MFDHSTGQPSAVVLVDDKFDQLCKVRADEIDGDEEGNEWVVHYVLYETQDDEGATCYDLYQGDGEGNGIQICRGYSQGRMRSLTLRLGELVEWKAGVPLIGG
jgi:hypothetical protein